MRTSPKSQNDLDFCPGQADAFLFSSTSVNEVRFLTARIVYFLVVSTGACSWYCFMRSPRRAPYSATQT